MGEDCPPARACDVARRPQGTDKQAGRGQSPNQGDHDDDDPNRRTGYKPAHAVTASVVRGLITEPHGLSPRLLQTADVVDHHGNHGDKQGLQPERWSAQSCHR